MIRVRAGQIDLERRLVQRGDGPIELTPIEVSVLRYLHARAGRIVPREELLREVWGYAAASRSQAVHVAIRRLRAKVERDPSAPEHLKSVAGVGWVLELDPVAIPGLVGRDGLLTTVLGRVREHPLVVLVGPGGIGKTTLAAAVVATVGAVFCDLSATEDGHTIDDAVARALGIDGDPTGPLAAAGLVVLDNVEQIARDIAERLPRWVEAGARLLVTSRVHLGVGQAVAVGPLDEPDAVALLVRRTASAPPPTGDLGPLVRLLECNPLCLELAAPRLRLLSPEALIARLEDRFAVLRTTHGHPERHLALEGSIEASWLLLAPAEQDALADLTVFRGGFTPDAAGAVLGDRALEHLQTLVDVSLVHRTGDRLEPWISVQELVRLRAGPRPEAERRHGAWFAAREPYSVDAADLANLLVAAERAVGLLDGRTAAACVHTLGILGTRLPVPGLDRLLARTLPLAEGVGRLRLVRLSARRQLRLGAPGEALATLAGVTSDDPLQEGLVRELRATILIRMRRADDAATELEAADRAFVAADRPTNRATVQVNAANVARLRGRTAEAEALLTAALAGFRALGDTHGEGVVLGNLAAVSTDRGDHAGAIRTMRDAVALLDRTGDRYASALMRGNLAELLLDAGAVDDAEQAARRALEDAQGVDLWATGPAQSALGQVALRRGDPDGARRWLLEAVATAERCEQRRARAVFQRHLAAVLRAVGDPDGARALLDAAIAALDGQQLALATADRANLS